MTNKMDSFSIDNYIVRIYRWDNDNPRRLVGVVEQVGLQGKLAFHNLDELWTILSSARSKLPRKKGR
ncbi:MAG TPA: hypothetical protein DCR39_01375 [Nitrospiraceae bacterium]|nr:hypothetical protein [Nitrospiraceae bacterium]